MLTPDLTYSFLRPKDVSGPTFEIFNRSATVTLANVLVEFDLTDLPKDRVLVLSNIAARADPGLAQANIAMVVLGFSAAGLEFDIARLNPVIAANQQEAMNWQGQVFLLGGGPGTVLLRTRASFDAGAVANELRVGIHGVVIPRANAAAF